MLAGQHKKNKVNAKPRQIAKNVTTSCGEMLSSVPQAQSSLELAMMETLRASNRTSSNREILVDVHLLSSFSLALIPVNP